MHHRTTCYYVAIDWSTCVTGDREGTRAGDRDGLEVYVRCTDRDRRTGHCARAACRRIESRYPWTGVRTRFNVCVDVDDLGLRGTHRHAEREGVVRRNPRLGRGCLGTALSLHRPCGG